MVGNGIFITRRAPDPVWVAELARIAPKRAALSHLVVLWYAGRPEPVQSNITQRWFVNGQRWVVHEAIPRQYVELLVDRLFALEDTTYDVELSRRYVEEHGYLLSPFWTIQGNDIGHPYKYTQTEASLARANGLPDRAPMIGELTYAEATPRTWHAIMQRSLIFSPHRHKDLADRRQAEQEQMAQASRQALVALASTTEEEAKYAARNMSLDLDPALDDLDLTMADGPTIDAHYIQTGVVDANPE